MTVFVRAGNKIGFSLPAMQIAVVVSDSNTVGKLWWRKSGVQGVLGHQFNGVESYTIGPFVGEAYFDIECDEGGLIYNIIGDPNPVPVPLSDYISGGGGGAVDSVNGKTGVVVLDADDVGALPDTYTPPVVRGVTTIANSSAITAANNNGNIVVCNSAGPITVTLNDDLPVGTVIDLVSIGAGVVTIAVQSGNLRTYTGKQPQIVGQYAGVTAIKNANGNVVLIGALADA